MSYLSGLAALNCNARLGRTHSVTNGVIFQIETEDVDKITNDGSQFAYT